MFLAEAITHLDIMRSTTFGHHPTELIGHRKPIPPLGLRGFGFHRPCIVTACGFWAVGRKRPEMSATFGIPPTANIGSNLPHQHPGKHGTNIPCFCTKTNCGSQAVTLSHCQAKSGRSPCLTIGNRKPAKIYNAHEDLYFNRLLTGGAVNDYLLPSDFGVVFAGAGVDSLLEVALDSDFLSPPESPAGLSALAAFL